MILPVVLGAFYRVLRQRIRIWNFERSQATHIKEVDIRHATDNCEVRTYAELKLDIDNNDQHVASVCDTRCAICMCDFEE